MTESNLLQYTHLMFDIETMGLETDAPILSIAAVPFNPDSGLILAKEKCFYRALRLQEELDAGAKPCAETILWWMNQSEGARQSLLMRQEREHYPAHEVLIDLTQFMFDLNMDAAQVKVWGNGAHFDITLLEAAHKRHQVDVPWKFYNVRCYRTLRALRPDLCAFKPEIKHDAVEDAYAQALNAIAIIQALPVVAANI